MDNKLIKDRIIDNLIALYGKEKGSLTWSELEKSLETYQQENPQDLERSSLDTLENLDALLITYADQIQSPGQTHIQTLANFIQGNLKGLTSTVHLLPFFPYSSDDGFSVIDYKAVDPEVGAWEDLDRFGNCCQLMFDAVVNHISSQSNWFKGFLEDQDPYTEYFLTTNLEADLSQVVRPRETPLLSEIKTPSGIKHVWTTFSPDQIDLNYKNPLVLLEIIDVLLFYVEKGARIIRLDAIAYLWKEIGTSCIHLPQTHQVIKLIRAVLDYVAPEVIIISETNVPHQENISYFGNQLPGSKGKYPLGDEAQMVYQFPLGPLVLHTFRTENATALTNWASSIETPFSSAVFLNFIASHDGIGVRPAEGLLSEEEIQGLVDQTLDHGGQVSYKTNPDGSKSVYELNITLYDALNHPLNEPQDQGVKRFLASQAIMLSLSGVPGIYIHSLFGSRNSHTSVIESGRVRSINREKFQLSEIKRELKDGSSRSSKVFSAYTHLLDIRKAQLAFKPLNPQQILDLDCQVFGVCRNTIDDSESILCLVNVTNLPVELSLDNQEIDLSFPGVDLLTGEKYTYPEIILDPYQILWIKNLEDKSK
ncbi:MAG: sugar phosphorylase [Anaerolineales bacterium]